MRPCRNCLENNWSFRTQRDLNNNTLTKWMLAVCNLCGHEEEFGFRNTELKHATAEYKNIRGKLFLKIDGKFTEVGLYAFKKFWKVYPVDHLRTLAAKRIL